MRYIHEMIVSAFGAGFIKFAPGTWGTLVGSIILIILWRLDMLDTGWMLLITTTIVTGIGYWSIVQLPSTWIHDDQRIVIDEVIGVWVTLLWIPISWKTLVLSFILFRLYDIFKPLGIRTFDNMKSDMGVMVDDIVAGVYANLTLRILIVVLSYYGIW